MKNQDIKSGLFGSIGENMSAFEISKRNWYVYRPYFDNRIDFIAQKFVCKKCFYDWESKHIICCSNKNCSNQNKELNKNSYIKTRKCLSCGFIFDKYAEQINCPECGADMAVKKDKRSGQRNYSYTCPDCDKKFTSQTRGCVKCKSNKSIEFPICEKCKSEIIPKNNKCNNSECNSEEYALIIRTIQVKSSHEEDRGTIGFNFKIQDLIDDPRHFLVVYSRTFEDYKEKHNFWVMSVEEFKKEYVSNNASTMIYQNARLHPPKDKAYFFDEISYNKKIEQIKEAKKKNDINFLKTLEKEKKQIDIFEKLNRKIKGDF
jgi:hypothetical protein